VCESKVFNLQDMILMSILSLDSMNVLGLVWIANK
jgi:hypothetical protein